jgi:SAM-dependent methyltransferase
MTPCTKCVIAGDYDAASVEARTATTYYGRFLDDAIARVPAGGRAVDLGCGAGLVAEPLARRAHVIGVELSREQLRLARVRVPTASFVLADMSRFEVRDASVDAVAAFWSIIHVRRELHADLVARIHGWLRPGGILFGTLGSGDNPDERDDFFGAPMSWSHFDADTNRRLLVEAGFTLEVADVVEDMDEAPLWVVARA